ncbi:MAG: response regulator [Chloroflexi bacterium]|nr:response regulator [Chloroflexota bacterium]
MRQSVTILLVEDNRIMLEGLVDLFSLDDIGYDVTILTASNGKIALERMQEATPDLIISDIMMPEMDGYEFLQQVRQVPAWRQIPFIFLSAKGGKYDVRTGRLSDADRYVTKPFVGRDLLAIIQTQLNRKAEKQLTHQQALDDLKKHTLQILNHELRTPLTYVTAYYEMLVDSLNNQNYQEHLRGIQIGCVRLTRLVNDFILVMALRSGESAARFQHQARPLANWQHILQAAVESKQIIAQEDNVKIECLFAADLPIIWGDPEWLHIIFDHLLDNAIKFFKPGKGINRLVVVSCFEETDQALIAFQDNGVGIPEFMNERIYDLFEQYNRSLIEQQGAGTGLTVARELVDLHGGHITLDSEVDRGSIFTVVLPTYQEGRIQLLQAAADGHGRHTATILLVEDDENLMAGLADLLTIHQGKYQLHVLTAVNGLHGLDVLQQQTPDLIISDIMMPQMDGYEFLKAVRNNPEWLNIPFIFLTARGEKRDRQLGYQLGVEEYITKPYDSDDVLQFIEKQLDKHFHSQQMLWQDFDSLKRNILKLISPEFMTPLTAVNEHTQKIASGLENTQNESQLTTSLKAIQSGSVQLNRLIEDFIALAELQTGEAAIAYNWQAQPIGDLGFLLYEMCHSFPYQHQLPNVYIHCAIQENLVTTFGDSSLILKNIDRLLQFGLNQAVLSRPEITVSAHNTDDSVLIKIQFSPALNPQALDAFETIQTKPDSDLSQLPPYAASLRIVKGQIGLHNGRLTLTTTTQSATFTIALPVYINKE